MFHERIQGTALSQIGNLKKSLHTISIPANTEALISPKCWICLQDEDPPKLEQNREQD